MANTGKLLPGTIVFWGTSRPWWIIEWQEDNGIGGSYWIVDASGYSGSAGDDELTLRPM